MPVTPAHDDREALAALLHQGIAGLGLDIAPAGQALLLDYLGLLRKWNRVYNLSGMKGARDMLELHLLDSLSVIPLITGLGRPHGGDANPRRLKTDAERRLMRRKELILDVGSGAGLPGIPLAVCLPDKTFILLDASGKKTRFLFQAGSTLQLDNVEVVNQRVETFQCDRQIDIVVTRAFSSLRQSLVWAGHLLGENNRLLAMKGHYPEDEVAEIPAAFSLVKSHVLAAPGQHRTRHVLEIIRNGEAAWR